MRKDNEMYKYDGSLGLLQDDVSYGKSQAKLNEALIWTALRTDIRGVERALERGARPSALVDVLRDGSLRLTLAHSSEIALDQDIAGAAMARDACTVPLLVALALGIGAADCVDDMQSSSSAQLHDEDGFEGNDATNDDTLFLPPASPRAGRGAGRADITDYNATDDAGDGSFSPSARAAVVQTLVRANPACATAVVSSITAWEARRRWLQRTQPQSEVQQTLLLPTYLASAAAAETDAAERVVGAESEGTLPGQVGGDHTLSREGDVEERAVDPLLPLASQGRGRDGKDVLGCGSWVVPAYAWTTYPGATVTPLKAALVWGELAVALGILTGLGLYSSPAEDQQSLSATAATSDAIAPALRACMLGVSPLHCLAGAWSAGTSGLRERLLELLLRAHARTQHSASAVAATDHVDAEAAYISALLRPDAGGRAPLLRLLCAWPSEAAEPVLRRVARALRRTCTHTRPQGAGGLSAWLRGRAEEDGCSPLELLVAAGRSENLRVLRTVILDEVGNDQACSVWCAIAAQVGDAATSALEAALRVRKVYCLRELLATGMDMGGKVWLGHSVTCPAMAHLRARGSLPLACSSLARTLHEHRAGPARVDAGAAAAAVSAAEEEVWRARGLWCALLLWLCGLRADASTASAAGVAGEVHGEEEETSPPSCKGSPRTPAASSVAAVASGVFPAMANVGAHALATGRDAVAATLRVAVSLVSWIQEAEVEAECWAEDREDEENHEGEEDCEVITGDSPGNMYVCSTLATLVRWCSFADTTAVLRRINAACGVGAVGGTAEEGEAAGVCGGMDVSVLHALLLVAMLRLPLPWQLRVDGDALVAALMRAAAHHRHVARHQRLQRALAEGSPQASKVMVWRRRTPSSGGSPPPPSTATQCLAAPHSLLPAPVDGLTCVLWLTAAHGIPINAPGLSGHTPIMLAALHGQLPALALLARMGAVQHWLAHCAAAQAEKDHASPCTVVAGPPAAAARALNTCMSAPSHLSVAADEVARAQGTLRAAVATSAATEPGEPPDLPASRAGAGVVSPSCYPSEPAPPSLCPVTLAAPVAVAAVPPRPLDAQVPLPTDSCARGLTALAYATRANDARAILTLAREWTFGQRLCTRGLAAVARDPGTLGGSYSPGSAGRESGAGVEDPPLVCPCAPAPTTTAAAPLVLRLCPFLPVPLLLSLADSTGLTPLHHAVRANATAAVELLIRARARADASCTAGHTALVEACRSGNNGAAVALLRGGADAGARAWKARSEEVSQVLVSSSVAEVVCSEEATASPLTGNAVNTSAGARGTRGRIGASCLALALAHRNWALVAALCHAGARLPGQPCWQREWQALAAGCRGHQDTHAAGSTCLPATPEPSALYGTRHTCSSTAIGGRAGCTTPSSAASMRALATLSRYHAALALHGHAEDPLVALLAEYPKTEARAATDNATDNSTDGGRRVGPSMLAVLARALWRAGALLCTMRMIDSEATVQSALTGGRRDRYAEECEAGRGAVGAVGGRGPAGPAGPARYAHEAIALAVGEDAGDADAAERQEEGRPARACACSTPLRGGCAGYPRLFWRDVTRGLHTDAAAPPASVNNVTCPRLAWLPPLTTAGTRPPPPPSPRALAPFGAPLPGWGVLHQAVASCPAAISQLLQVLDTVDTSSTAEATGCSVTSPSPSTASPHSPPTAASSSTSTSSSSSSSTSSLQAVFPLAPASTPTGLLPVDAAKASTPTAPASQNCGTNTHGASAQGVNTQDKALARLRLLSALTHHGDTVLILACARGMCATQAVQTAVLAAEAVEAITNVSSVEPTSRSPKRAQAHALSQYLLLRANNSGLTPLMQACARGDQQQVALLLDWARMAGTPVTHLLDKRDIHGRNALMYASMGGYAPLLRDLLVEEYTLPSILFAEDAYGVTALMCAAASGSAEALCVILVVVEGVVARAASASGEMGQPSSHRVLPLHRGRKS